MNTIDRINRLLIKYGGALLEGDATVRDQWPACWQGSLHTVLNHIDSEAGMNTRGGSVTVYWSNERKPVNPVGARVWRHERRLDGAVPYFHMGKEAELLVA
jgi:hypothetical protein